MSAWANFDEAYDWIITSFNAVFSACDSIDWQYSQAQHWNDLNQYKIAIQYLINARGPITTGLKSNTTYQLLKDPLYAICGCFDFMPEPSDPYELTWQKICEAWAVNDFEGMEWTIACIDRMRQLMWDKPFSIKWASKPDSQR